MESRKRLYLLSGKCVRVFVLAIIAFFVFGNDTICYAGDINSNEARVLAVAQGTFEYNGELYVAKPEYVNQLNAKMNLDEVDLTAEQADEAINRIYENVETGVEAGYIVKLKDQEQEPDENTGNGNNSDDKTQGENQGDGNRPDDENIGEEQPEETTVNENENGTLTVEDGKGNVVLEFEGVLKNTGFSIEKTITIMIIIGVILLCVVVYSVKDIIVIHKK